MKKKRRERANPIVRTPSPLDTLVRGGVLKRTPIADENAGLLNKLLPGGALQRQHVFDEDEERYLRWLEAPGDALGMVLGDAPTIEDVLRRRSRTRSTPTSAKKRRRRR